MVLAGKNSEPGFILLDVLHAWDETHERAAKLKKGQFFSLKQSHNKTEKQLSEIRDLLKSLPAPLLKKHAHVPVEELIHEIDEALSKTGTARTNQLWKLCKHRLPSLESKIELMFREEGRKVHPLRVFPLGSYWVRQHPRQLPRGVTVVDGHCRRNPSRSRKDHLYSTETRRISESFFKNKTIIGNKKIPTFRPEVSNRYDGLIQGWVDYWNEVMKPEKPLSADIVKALVGSESTFNIKPKDQKTDHEGMARGLFQLTDKTRSHLSNLKGELRAHYLEVSVKDVYTAESSIAAGIRWLFHKKSLAEHRLKRKITWEEAVADYKGLGRQINNGKYLTDRDYKPFKDMLDLIRRKK